MLALSVGAASALGRNFDNPASHDSAQQFSAANPQRQDTPNDPGYDSAEPDDEDGVSTTNLYDEQFGLFGFPSQHTRSTAIYATGPNAGKPQVVEGLEGDHLHVIKQAAP